jgi:hypothetical protein
MTRYTLIEQKADGTRRPPRVVTLAHPFDFEVLPLEPDTTMVILMPEEGWDDAEELLSKTMVFKREVR